MVNVSDCGELHNELRKPSDIDELFARVPLPDNEICQSWMMHSRLPILLWKMQKFAMLVHNCKIAHLQVVQRVVLDVLRLRPRSLLHRKILYPSIQKRVQIEQ